jgi:hypothetical protein
MDWIKGRFGSMLQLGVHDFSSKASHLARICIASDVLGDLPNSARGGRYATSLGEMAILIDSPLLLLSIPITCP